MNNKTYVRKMDKVIREVAKRWKEAAEKLRDRTILDIYKNGFSTSSQNK